ncbi:MAG TPA: aldo/keto reductase [Quisquiliibacterium sp.]|nr:aldo/keto reductase [Quisquiliibacterium sp.]
MSERIRLGASDLEVPRICLGTMTFGRQNTERDGHLQLNYAYERGIDFIDTAEVYPIPVNAETAGATERIVGSWLRGKPRDKVILASKVAGPGRGMDDWLRAGAREGCKPLDKRDIVQACEASLRRLGTDYLDLYQIHWPARNVPQFGANRFDEAAEREAASLREQLEAMARLVKDGKVRHVGVSNETAWGVCEATRLADRFGLPRIAGIQNVYNLMSREFEQALREACFRERVGLLAYSPLAFGWLSGKYRGGAKPAGARMTLFGDGWPRYAKPEIPAAADAYAAIAARFELTPTQLALGFVASRPFVASTIVGATTMDQLRQCIDGCNTRLPDEALAAIEEEHQRMPNPAP